MTRRIYPVLRQPRYVSERVLMLAHITAALTDDVLSEADKIEMQRVAAKLTALSRGEVLVAVLIEGDA